MTQLRLTPGVAATEPWRTQVDDLTRAVRALPGDLAAAWCVELDAAQARTAVPVGPSCGVHALLVLAGARLGERWDPRRLIDLAAAVELTHRAIGLHADVRNGPPGDTTRHAHNIRQVLQGDLAITKAALLACGAGPAAYQMLVRGFGACQIAALQSGAVPACETAPLAVASFGLGALAAGVSNVRLPADLRTPMRQVWSWALTRGGWR